MYEFQKGDIVATRANNLAIVGDVRGLSCDLKILKTSGNRYVGENQFSNVATTTLTRTGIHVEEKSYVCDSNGRTIIRYLPVFRHHITCLATGELRFAIFEEWEDSPQGVKDAQLLAAVENACKCMDEIAKHWQLVRV